MRITTIIMTVLVTNLVLPAMDAVAKDDVYRWVDENGVVHFGDRADGQSNAEKIIINKSKSNSVPPASIPEKTATTEPTEKPPSYAQQRRDERAKKREEAAKIKKEITAGCQQRIQIVQQLESSPRVIVENEDGSVSRLDDNTRLEVLAEAQTYIESKCDK